MAAILSAAAVNAATLTWTGAAGNGNVTTAGNWSPAQVPATGDVLIFGGATGLAPQLGTALSLNSITFNNTAGAFTLGGAGIYTLGAGGITNNDADLQTINNGIALGAAQSWTANTGALVFGGAVNNGGFLLTVGGNFNTTISSVISGAGGLTKTGAGILALNGANTYLGGTNVGGGTMRIGASERLANSGALTVSGGTFDLQTFNETVGNVTLTSGSIIGIGTATLTGSSYAMESGTVGAILAGTAGLTKSTLGTVILSRANTFSGATTVNAGVLNIQNANGLGTTAGGTTVSTGAALQLQGGIAVGTEALTLSGSGIASDGALRNISGTNSMASAIALASNTTIGSDAGTLALSGVISGGFALTKVGPGTLTLSNTNTFSGGLTLNGGTVSVSSDASLGAAGAALSFTGGTLQTTANVLGSRAIAVISGATFGGTYGTTHEQTGVVSGNGNLTVVGSATLILSGSGSNGTGATILDGGVLSLRGTVALGSGNLNFVSGILELGNSNFTRALGVGPGQVDMNSATGGAGFSAYGADRIVNLGGSGATVTWGVGNFVAAGQTLYLGGQTANAMVDFQNSINLNGATRVITVTDGVGTGIDAKLSGAISGAGASNLLMESVGFAPWNPGSLLLSNGNNSYAGITAIYEGTLLVGANATGTVGNTVLGSGASDVLVGSTTGAFNAGLLTNGAFTIARNIRLQSGNTGSMSIGGYTADASTFSGRIYLGSASSTGKSVTLTAANGGTTTFSGVVQDPSGVFGPGLVTKAGAGTVVLSGANTYAGATTVSAGILNLRHSSALGATSAGTTVATGAEIQLEGGIAVGAETLTLNGTGATGNGALRNMSGNNTWAGNITLGTTSVIQ